MGEQSMESRLDQSKLAFNYETAFEHDKWMEEIPFIKFPDNWQVKMVPPFGRAVVRFFVKRDGMNDRVSIYFDAYGHLGYYGKMGEQPVPYWEVFPGTEDGEINRFGKDDTDGFLEAIKIGLDHIEDLESKREDNSDGE